MRKHFLILMLLTLLPLAGFAAVDISTGYVVTIKGTGAMVYDGKDYASRTDAKKIALIVKKADASDALSAETDYDLKFYAEDGVTPVTQVVNAGDYWVSAVAKESTDFTGETQKISFHISKSTLKYTLKTSGENSINFTRAYKSADFANKKFSAANVELTGNAEDDDVDDLFTFANDEGTTATWSYSGSNANFNTDGIHPLVNGDKGYEVQLEGFTPKEHLTKNYDFEYTKNYVKITQLEITAVTQDWDVANLSSSTAVGWYATENPAEPYTYNGAKQVPSYTLYYVYADGTGKKSEVVSENANITYAYTKNSIEIGEPIDADEVNKYIVYVSGVANTNYTVGATPVEMGKFQINRAPLTLYVNPKTKEYWGAAWTASDATFSNPVLLGRDNGKEITGSSLTVVTAGGLKKDVLYTTQGLLAGYEVKADVTSAQIVMDPADPSKNVSLTTNYKVTTPVSNWTVTPKALTFSIEADPVVYPAVPNSTTITWDVQGVVIPQGETEPEAVKACFEAVFDAAVIANPAEVYPKDTYQNAIKIQQISTLSPEQTAMLKNYSIDLTAASTKCNLVVSGANFKIVPAIENVQYGTPITPQYLAYTATAEVATVDPEKVVILYKEEGSTEEFTTERPTKVGTYLATVKLDVEGLGTGNFEGGQYTTEEITFKINPKDVTININDVKLWNGATLAIMQAKAAAATDDYANDLEPNETIELEYAYVETNANAFGENLAALDNAKTITFGNSFPQAGVNGVITATPKAGQYNGNYNITVTGGKLLQIATPDAMNLALSFDDDNSERIADAAAICTANTNVKYNVTMGANTMLANEWYAIVLPFATSAYDLVDKLGQYVVVNTYGTDSELGNIKFHLEMGDIAAGVPFLIKAGTNLDWTNKQFTNKKIVAAPVAQGDLTTTGSVFTGVFSNSCILQDGYELDGATENQELAYRWLSHTTDETGWSTAKNTWRTAKGSDHHRHALMALEAYLQVPVGANPARITVEDFDGQTTSIQTLNAGDLKAVTVDGWYTIDGIKLQGAPTQKGIYINNGRKVVLK